MANQLERRRYLRLDVTSDVRALTEQGQFIGRVEKVGAGGLQIRASSPHQYQTGSQFVIHVVEPNKEQQRFKVEIRVCDGSMLGVQFIADAR